MIKRLYDLILERGSSLMKYLKHALFLVFITLSGAAFSAETIAVIDMQKVRAGSVAINKVLEKIKKKRDSYQAEITKQEESLRDGEKKLAEQHALLTPEAFKAKRDDFQKQKIEVLRGVQEKRAQLDKIYSAALVELQKSVIEIVAQLSKEKGFDIALPLAQVVYSSPSLDITDQVLEKVNKKLPSIKVDIN